MTTYEVNREEDGKKNPIVSFFTSLGHFLWNSEKREFIGRTGKSWGLIIIFYLIYYTCLAGFFIGMLAIFLNLMVTKDIPRQTGYQSILRGAPGVGYAPKFDYASTLVEVTTKNTTFYRNYTKAMAKALESYPNVADADSKVVCDLKKGTKSVDDIEVPCPFFTSNLGPCADAGAELLEGRTCIYLRVNKVYGWVPPITNKTLSNNILVTCTGQNDGDKENIGEIVYYPSLKGDDGETYGVFSNLFFPYLNQKDFRQPLVAAQFKDIKMNVAVLIQCQLQNIRDVAGNTKFELLVRSN